MTGHYIYIDESGDPGTKPGCSSDFIIAAVVVVGEEERDKLEKALVTYCRGLGWSNDKELKFHQSGKDAIRLALRATSGCDYGAYATILDKRKLSSGQLRVPERDLTALYVTSELLKELTLSDAVITIDGAYGRKFITKARTYLRQQLRSAGISYNSIRFVDSKKSPLVQLADLVAGSVAKSISSNSNDKEFVRILGDKLKKTYKL